MSPWQALGVGIGLGLGAGITPGPLLGLVISETLRAGWRAGVLVALAPPVADLAVVFLCFLVLIRLPPFFLPALGIAGGLYVMALGWETLWTTPPADARAAEEPVRRAHSFLKGLLVNLFNPHPYLFWLTVAGPLLTESYRHQRWAPIAAFVCGFYGFLVGSKVLLAVLTHSGRVHLHGRGYRFALRVTGGALLVFGAVLVGGGVRGLLSV
ncbi:MAG: LysE family translocator [Thermodesulfobacteriota bacterium]|jgi:threonine/homoserine/homoserine lactone efflux protein